MAVSDYYTSDDLLIRRTAMANWICSQLEKFVNYYHYGSIIKKDCIIKHQYITALLETVECYTPITLAAQDGVDNCLTEAKLTKIFDNVEEITGLCFLPMGTTYSPNYDSTVPLLEIGLNSGEALLSNIDEEGSFDFNKNERSITE